MKIDKFFFLIILLICSAISLKKNKNLPSYPTPPKDPFIFQGEIIQETREEISKIKNQQDLYYKIVSNIYPFYPLNDGAEIGTRRKGIIKEGKILFSYGHLNGSYFTDQCTPIEKVSEPYWSKDYNRYCFIVIKAFPTEIGVIKPWFTKPGGAIQYSQINKSLEYSNISNLLKNKYIQHYYNCRCPVKSDES